MNLSIAEMGEADREELRILYLEIRKDNFVWLNSNSLQLSSFDSDIEGEYVLVGRINGEIVGFISAWLPDNFIHHLFIANNYQRIGIGKQLLKQMIQKLGSPVILKCLKSNIAAVRFYVRNGWKAKSEAISDDGPYILFEYVKA